MFFPKKVATKLAILCFKRPFVKLRHWKYTVAFHLFSSLLSKHQEHPTPNGRRQLSQSSKKFCCVSSQS